MMNTAQEILLETSRLVLRRLTAADEDNLCAIDNDPAVMRYLNGGCPTPRNVVRKALLPVFTRRDPCHPGFGFWALVEKATGEFVGWVSFRPTGPDPAEATLGYRLGKAAWGKGYATEAARAVIRKGFTEMGVRRVVTTTYEENLASRRVMEKTGMRLARVFRYTPQDAEQTDTFHAGSTALWEGYDLEYTLEKSEWERREAVEP